MLKTLLTTNKLKKTSSSIAFLSFLKIFSIKKFRLVLHLSQLNFSIINTTILFFIVYKQHRCEVLNFGMLCWIPIIKKIDQIHCDRSLKKRIKLRVFYNSIQTNHRSSFYSCSQSSRAQNTMIRNIFVLHFDEESQLKRSNVGDFISKINELLDILEGSHLF